MQHLPASGNTNIEQSPLLLKLNLGFSFFVRHHTFIQIDYMNSIKLQSLGTVKSHKLNSITAPILCIFTELLTILYHIIHFAKIITFPDQRLKFIYHSNQLVYIHILFRAHSSEISVISHSLPYIINCRIGSKPGNIFYIHIHISK